jgi:outer membrane receptor protein involved in Fe transport
LNLRTDYLWNRAAVTDFPADRSLEGLRLPQVPEHRATLTTDFLLPRGFRFGLVGRFVGNQFDDDRNVLVLQRYFQLDARASRTLGESSSVFLSFENLTNTEIQVQRTPVTFIGTPFAVRAGIHFRLHGGSTP